MTGQLIGYSSISAEGKMYFQSPSDGDRRDLFSTEGLAETSESNNCMLQPNELMHTTRRLSLFFWGIGLLKCHQHLAFWH